MRIETQYHQAFYKFHNQTIWTVTITWYLWNLCHHQIKWVRITNTIGYKGPINCKKAIKNKFYSSEDNSQITQLWINKKVIKADTIIYINLMAQ